MKFALRSRLLAACAAVLLCAVSVAAQEAMFDSYAQAAYDAYQRGSYPEAERLAKLALAEAEKLQGKDRRLANRTMIKGLNALSAIQIEQEKYGEAEPVKRAEIALLERMSSADYPEYATNYPMSLESLGLILTEQKKYEEAEGAYRKALEYREKEFGASDRRIATSLINMGGLYRRQGKLAEAEVMSRRALGIFSGSLDAGDFTEDDMFMFVRAARTLAQVSTDKKNYAEAGKQYKFVIASLEKLYGVRDESLTEPLQEYAVVLRALKRSAEAVGVENRVKRLQANKRD